MYYVDSFNYLCKVLTFANRVGSIPIAPNFKRRMFYADKKYLRKRTFYLLFDIFIVLTLWFIAYLDYLSPHVLKHDVARAYLYFGIVFYPTMLIFDYIIYFRLELALAGGNMAVRFLGYVQGKLKITRTRYVFKQPIFLLRY